METTTGFSTQRLLLFFPVLLGAGMLVAWLPTLWAAGLMLLVVFTFAMFVLSSGVVATHLSESAMLFVLVIGTAISASLEFPSDPPFHRGGSPLAFCIYPSDVALVVVVAYLLLRGRSPASPTPSLRRFLAFLGLWLAIALVGSAVAAFPLYTLAEVARLIKFAGLGVAAYLLVTDWRTIERVALAGALIVLAEGALIATQSFSDVAREVVIPVLGIKDATFSNGLYRPSGTLGHPNVAGLYYAIAVLLAFPRIVARRENLLDRILVLVVVVAAAAGAFAAVRTGSRGASLALAAGIATWLFWPYLRPGRRRPRAALATVAVAALVLLGGWFALDSVGDRFTTMGEDNQSVARIDLALTALEMIPQSPILGVGLNNFAEVFDQYAHQAVRFEPPYEPVHNMLLLVLSETGILGLVAFLAMIVVPVREAWRLADSPRERGAEWGRMLIALAVTLALNAQVDHSVLSPTVLGLLSIVFGLTFAAGRLDRQAAEATPA